MTAGSRTDDERFMRRALELAARGIGQVSPNPLVGAVIVRDGEIVGEGWHARYGDAHAEVMALRAADHAAVGATAYVTLEPCHHHGKTPPCTQALSAAGIARVVYAISDPNPKAGGGGAALASQGVQVESGVCAREAEELNAPFVMAMRGAERPFVTVKLAMSIDGAIVDQSRARGWLTGPEARRVVHEMRAQSDAIGVGIGTALADDPALTVREVAAPRVAPLRVIFDRGARLPLDSTLMRTIAQAPVVVVTDGRARDREAALAASGAEILTARSLDETLRALGTRGVRHLLIEGGSEIASALLEAGLVNRLIIFQAPVILGAGALPAFAALPSKAVESAARLRIVARRELGDDLMTTYAVSGD